MQPFDPVLQLIAAQARVKTCHAYHCFQAMRVQGKQFHAGAFALFAGLEERHVLAIIAALSDHSALPEGRAKVERRASRLPPDWTPPEDYITYAVDKRRWTPVEAAQEAEAFHNYFLAAPGEKGLKLDWLATWRNWTTRSSRPDGTYRTSGPIVSSREHLEGTIRVYEMQGRYTEAEEIRVRLAAESNVVQLRA